MEGQMFEILVLLVICLAGVRSRSQETSQLQTSTDSVPVQNEPEKTLDGLLKENGVEEEEQEYHVRIPPPFVEEFAGVPRPSRRWPDKTRGVRDLSNRVGGPSITPSCGEHVNPCTCCCKYCWEYLFQSLKLCFNACSSAHENCQCQKSKFHPLDFKRSDFVDKRGTN